MWLGAWLALKNMVAGNTNLGDNQMWSQWAMGRQMCNSPVAPLKGDGRCEHTNRDLPTVSFCTRGARLCRDRNDRRAVEAQSMGSPENWAIMQEEVAEWSRQARGTCKVTVHQRGSLMSAGPSQVQEDTCPIWDWEEVMGEADSGSFQPEEEISHNLRTIPQDSVLLCEQ